MHLNTGEHMSAPYSYVETEIYSVASFHLTTKSVHRLAGYSSKSKAFFQLLASSSDLGD